LRTIKDTFSDHVNFLNRINQGKINKDFERIAKVVEVFKENKLDESICVELETALSTLYDIISKSMSNGGLDMLEPTKEARKILVEAMDSFSNNSDVKEINYVISKKIPKEKIRFSKYRSNRGKEELVRSQNKGIEYLSNNKTPSLPPPQTQTFNLLPPTPPQPKPQTPTPRRARVFAASAETSHPTLAARHWSPHSVHWQICRPWRQPTNSTPTR
jgi:flagellin-specific chaperone FliS